MHFQPHSYQARSIEFLKQRREALLFLGMGLGKTVCVLTAFTELKAKYPHLRMLLVAPKRVCQEVWPREIGKWDHTKRLRWVFVHGTDKARLLQLNRDIYIINYDGLQWLSEQTWDGAHILCLDEIGKMKSWSSKRMKAFKPFLPTFKVRWGLNGKPAPNGLVDLFSQVYCTDLGKTFGKRITHFRAKYFVQDPITNKYTPHRLGEQEIYGKLSKISLTMRGADYLELPEEVYNEIPLTLPDKLKDQYRYLAKNLILELQKDKIVATSQAALKMKLRQFLSGCSYSEEGIVELHDIKYQALSDLADGLNGQQMLVGYHFKHEVTKLLNALPGDSKAAITSMTNPKELQTLVNMWSSGDLQFLIGNPASIGHGLNLQESQCQDIWINSLDFNYDNIDQFIKRVSRQGNKAKQVVIHCPIFKGTVDGYLRKCLQDKEDIEVNLLNYLVENQNG